jgi:hypothetical protein
VTGDRLTIHSIFETSYLEPQCQPIVNLSWLIPPRCLAER